MCQCTEKFTVNFACASHCSVVVGFPLPSRKVKILGEELGYNKVNLLLLVSAVMILLQNV